MNNAIVVSGFLTNLNDSIIPIIKDNDVYVHTWNTLENERWIQKLNRYKMGFLDAITLSNKTLSILFYVTFFIFIIPAWILAIMIAVKKNEETVGSSIY